MGGSGHCDQLSSCPARSAAVEILRIFGCVGVCMFHAGTAWPRHVLPGSEMFMALTVAFAARAMDRQRLGALVKSRFMTLIVTWLIWCVIYAAYRSVSAWRDGLPLLSWAQSIHILTAGTLPQLWFPPFAFVVTVSACVWVAAGRRFGWSTGSVPFAIAAGVVMVPCAAAQLLSEEKLIYPYRDWVRMLPAAMMGLALARIPLGGRGARAPLMIVWVITMGGALLATALGWSDVPSRYFATCTLVCVAWCVPIAAPRWVLLVSQLTFGVYLSHMGMLYLSYFLAARAGLPVNAWAAGSAATILAFCFVPFVRYTRLRWMVGIWTRPEAASSERSVHGELDAVALTETRVQVEVPQSVRQTTSAS